MGYNEAAPIYRSEAFLAERSVRNLAELKRTPDISGYHVTSVQHMKRALVTGSFPGTTTRLGEEQHIGLGSLFYYDFDICRDFEKNPETEARRRAKYNAQRDYLFQYLGLPWDNRFSHMFLMDLVTMLDYESEFTIESVHEAINAARYADHTPNFQPEIEAQIIARFTQDDPFNFKRYSKLKGIILTVSNGAYNDFGHINGWVNDGEHILTSETGFPLTYFPKVYIPNKDEVSTLLNSK